MSLNMYLFVYLLVSLQLLLIQACVHRKFGLACQNICHCANNWDCDKETGVCPEGACDEGYGSNTCSIKLPTLSWRNENTARPVYDTNHVRIVFYQFKRGPRAYLDSGDGPVGEYTVDVKEEGSNDWAAMATFKHDTTKDRLDVTVTGLKYYRQYTMRVVPWYQRGGVKLEGRAQRTFTVRTSCGHPEKPVITNISAKRVTEGAEMTVMFTLSKYGHNCKEYWKVDVRYRRLTYVQSTGWTDYDWFRLEDRQVAFLIGAEDMTTVHEALLKIYNDEDRWVESESTTFLPITVQYCTPSIPWSSSPSNAVKESTNISETNTTTNGQAPEIISTISSQKTSIIAGAVVSVFLLIIIIVLLVYIWMLKRGTKKSPATQRKMLEIQNEHVTDGQEGNVEADVPGDDGEYENVELSPVESHTLENEQVNKYETLDEEDVTPPAPTTYELLGLTGVSES